MRAGILFAAFLLFCGTPAVAQEVVVGFAVAKTPFVFAESPDQTGDNRGIEIAVARAAFGEIGLTVVPVYAWRDHLDDLLADGEVDAASALHPGEADGYFSDEAIFFQNLAIVPPGGPTFGSLDDLAGRRVVAWGGAVQDLGPDFEAVIPKMATFVEIADQKLQVENFLDGSFDTIVIDKNIFAYWARQAGKDPDDYVNSELFGPRSGYGFVFTSEGLRDQFNQGLAAIKASGAFNGAYERYGDEP